ncbi:hypothetical protein PSQ90_16025 [Devosia rhodophyticola]|uniref:SPOR domain-containing protein n=1 Tax=Devosia rhodophyticola TaxID=3026423 RepID=A0ABY7YWJ6_9HYPH|nr:hypothetical protein [Devosia rhodophyticola]WDR05736.1 hypothetical protein PSQ90_16025 [Devosia rhodophyticola]
MAKASAQFQQSDIAIWGIVALACCGIAVMSANISAILPAEILSGLHATRLQGANLEQLRGQVGDLRNEATRLRRENNTLVTRFSLQEQANNEVTRRVGSLEVSLPKLLEALPPSAQIDRSALTGGIKEGESLSYDADGGSVKIRQQPLETLNSSAQQPIPAPLDAPTVTPDENAFGIAIGHSVPFSEAQSEWEDLSIKLGPLLFGLGPLLVDQVNTENKRIVVGPITQMSEATALCSRLERISIACMPVPFSGTPL